MDATGELNLRKKREKKRIAKSQETKKEEVKDESVLVYTSEKNEDKTKETRYIILCHFCGNKNYKHLGGDSQSTWCEECGKCIPLDWQKEIN